MIREATHDDIPAMVDLGRLMHDESPRFRGMAYDADKVSACLEFCIDSADGFVRVAEEGGEIVGGFVAGVTPHYSSPSIIACDIAVFMAPWARGGFAVAKMAEQYRRWAEARGAAQTMIGIMTGVNVEQTERLLTRLGWRRAGVVMEA